MNNLRQLIELCIEMLEEKDFYIYVGDEKIEKDAKILKESFKQFKKDLTYISLKDSDKEVINTYYNDLIGIKDNINYNYYELYEKLIDTFEKCEDMVNGNKNQDNNKKVGKGPYSLYDIKITVSSNHEIDEITIHNHKIKTYQDLINLLGQKNSNSIQALYILYYIVSKCKKIDNKTYKIDLGKNTVIKFISKLKRGIKEVDISEGSYNNYLSVLRKILDKAGSKVTIPDKRENKGIKNFKIEAQDKNYYTIKILN